MIRLCAQMDVSAGVGGGVGLGGVAFNVNRAAVRSAKVGSTSGAQAVVDPKPLGIQISVCMCALRPRQASPAKGHGTKGVAPLVLEQASAKLGQAAEEEAERHGNLRGASRLRQLRLGALQQRGGQGEAVQAQGCCREGEGARVPVVAATPAGSRPSAAGRPCMAGDPNRTHCARCLGCDGGAQH